METEILEELKEKNLIEVEIQIEETGTSIDRINMKDSGIMYMMGRIEENNDVAVKFLDELLYINKDNEKSVSSLLGMYSDFFKDKFDINLLKILKENTELLTYADIRSEDIKEEWIDRYDS